MDISAEEVKYLSAALETRPVTYHTAARDLNLHVSKSKKMLLDYFNVNKNSVTASFVVSGTRQGNTVIKVYANETELASQTDAFDEIRTVHVYSLSLSKNSILNSEIAVEELRHPVDLANLPHAYTLGLTKGTDVAHVVAQAPKPATGQPQPKPEASRTKPEAPKAKPEAPKPKLEYQSRKEKAKTPSLISNYVSRKGEAPKLAVPAKRETSTKPSYQYKSRKTEQSQPKERVVMSNVDDDDMQVDAVAPSNVADPASTGKSDLNNLFLDDLSDFSDDTRDDADEPIAVESSDPDRAQKPADDDSSAPSEVPEPENSILRTLAASTTPNSATPQHSPSPAPQTTVDEDGYITTYRAKDPVPKKPSVQDPVKVARAPSKKTDGKKKQASLMSFFGKR